MNLQSEQKKIAAILESGQFEWRGTVWQVDPVATKDHYLNANLAGKPLMKLVGVGTHGEVVSLWSHDVSTVDTPVAVVEVPEYVVDDTADPFKDNETEPEQVETKTPFKFLECNAEPSRRGRKKTTLKKERL